MKRFSDVLKTGAAFGKAKFEWNVRYSLSKLLCSLMDILHIFPLSKSLDG